MAKNTETRETWTKISHLTFPQNRGQAGGPTVQGLGASEGGVTTSWDQRGDCSGADEGKRPLISEEFVCWGICEWLGFSNDSLLFPLSVSTIPSTEDRC